MVSHHINPYSYGPNVLGATPFNQLADSVWSGTESHPTARPFSRSTGPSTRPPATRYWLTSCFSASSRSRGSH